MISDDDTQFWNEICDQTAAAHGFRPLSIEESERELFAAPEVSISHSQVEAVVSSTLKMIDVPGPAVAQPSASRGVAFSGRTALTAAAILAVAAVVVAGVFLMSGSDSAPQNQPVGGEMFAKEKRSPTMPLYHGKPIRRTQPSGCD